MTSIARVARPGARASRRGAPEGDWATRLRRLLAAPNGFRPAVGPPRPFRADLAVEAFPADSLLAQRLRAH